MNDTFKVVLKQDMYPNNFRPSVKHVLGVLECYKNTFPKIEV